MGRGIAAIAVRITRIVVPPLDVGGHRLFQQSPEIVRQRFLPFINKHGGGGMERLYDRYPVTDAAFGDQSLQALGQIDKLNSLPSRVVEHSSEGTRCRALSRTAGSGGVAR